MPYTFIEVKLQIGGNMFMKGFKADQAGSAHKPEMYVLEVFICFQCFAFQPYGPRV